MKYYPAFLDLTGRPVLLVGGGRVAELKARQLLRAGAMVRLVSPSSTRGLRTLAGKGTIEWRKRTFATSDLAGVWLVVAATDDARVQRRVAAAARARRVFCNTVDVPALCSFIAPAVVRRGHVQIAVSTAGQSPALAQRLKRELAERVGPEYGKLARLLGRARGEVRRRLARQRDRAAVFQRLAQSRLLELFRAGRDTQARREARRLLAAIPQP